MKKREIAISPYDQELLYVPLTKGQVAIANADDLELLSKFNWCCSSGYAVTNIQLLNGKRKLLQMHRLLLNPPEDLQIDHIDGNRLNNCRENLRICSHAENQRNRSRNSTNTSGFKGVSWDKQRERFRASIKFNDKQKHLGYFDDPQEAAAAYDAAAIELHKDFACTNGVLA